MTGDERIPFHRPSLGAAERDAVLGVLESGWLTSGPKVQELEAAMAGLTGARHVVAVNSATAALHLALEALGIGEGDEVIVPTYTFAASAEVVLYQRANPVLVDVDDATGNVRAADIATGLTQRTRAVEVVHIAGLAADLPELLAAAGDLPLIEDAAHALPVPVPELDGRMAGTVGLAGAFSFYATKTVTTGEGGVLVTADDRIAERARSMRLHGIGRDGWRRYTATGSWYYEIEAAGFKYNLPDLAAAIGVVQVARANELRAARAAIAARYLAAFAGAAASGQVILPADAPGHAWHLFMLRLGPEAVRSADDDDNLPGVAGLPMALRPIARRRAHLIARLSEAGIGTSVHFIPLHLHPLYQARGYRSGQFPAAEALYASEISLPIWPGMADAHVDRVVDAVFDALATP